MFEIDRHRAHTEIALDEARCGVDILVLAVVAKSIETALLRFDLDYLCAVAGEQPAGERPGITGGEGEDANAFQYFVSTRHSLTPRRKKIRNSDPKISKRRIRKGAGLKLLTFGHLKLFRASDFVLRIFGSWRLRVFSASHLFVFFANTGSLIVLLLLSLDNPFRSQRRQFPRAQSQLAAQYFMIMLSQKRCRCRTGTLPIDHKRAARLLEAAEHRMG